MQSARASTNSAQASCVPVQLHAVSLPVHMTGHTVGTSVCHQVVVLLLVCLACDLPGFCSLS